MRVSLWAVWNLPVLDRRDRDQATGIRLLVQHSGPGGRAVCRIPLRHTAKRKAWLSAVGPTPAR
jgi:hypothetical protein